MRAVEAGSSYAVIAALVLAGAAAGIKLGAPSLWYDETVSVAFATLPWSQFVTAVRYGDAALAPYYALLHVWTSLFGTSEAAVRSLSALAAVATIPVVYALGRALLGTRTAVFAAVLLAVAPLPLVFARQARPYSGAILLSAISSLLFLYALRRDTARAWVGYVVATALAAYAHVFAGLLVFAHALALLTDRRTARLWPRFAICVAAIVFALVPLLGLILGNETKSPGWITRPGSMELAFVFVMFAGSLPVLVVEVALIVNALRFGVGRWEYRFLLAWLLVPIVVAFCVSQVKPVFAPRYLSIAFIPFVLLVADGAARLRPAFGIAAIALIAAFSARTIARSYLAPLEDWRSAVAFVNTHGASRDGELLYHAHVATPERYYRARLPNARAGPTLVYPSPDRYVFWAAYPDGSDPLRSVFSHFAGERLWLVVSFSENDDPEVFDEVRALESGITERGFRCSERQRFRRITVLRYDRHPAATRQAAPVRCGGDRG